MIHPKVTLARPLRLRVKTARLGSDWEDRRQGAAVSPGTPGSVAKANNLRRWFLVKGVTSASFARGLRPRHHDQHPPTPTAGIREPSGVPEDGPLCQRSEELNAIENKLIAPVRCVKQSPRGVCAYHTHTHTHSVPVQWNYDGKVGVGVSSSPSAAPPHLCAPSAPPHCRSD